MTGGSVAAAARRAAPPPRPCAPPAGQGRAAAAVRARHPASFPDTRADELRVGRAGTGPCGQQRRRRGRSAARGSTRPAACPAASPPRSGRDHDAPPASYWWPRARQVVALHRGSRAYLVAMALGAAYQLVGARSIGSRRNRRPGLPRLSARSGGADAEQRRCAAGGRLAGGRAWPPRTVAAGSDGYRLIGATHADLAGGVAGVLIYAQTAEVDAPGHAVRASGLRCVR